MKLYKSFLLKATYAIASIRRILINNLVPNVYIAKGTIIEAGVELRSQYGGNISVGSNCIICRGAQLITHGDDIYIGNNSTVNSYTIIYGQGGVKIGNGVRIAAHCTIVPSNHIYTNPNEFIYKQGLSRQGIIIEDDVWIGSGVRVLDGVIIRKGCVIGANAVIILSTDEYGVYVGVPARKIKSRK